MMDFAALNDSMKRIVEPENHTHRGLVDSSLADIRALNASSPGVKVPTLELGDHWSTLRADGVASKHVQGGPEWTPEDSSRAERVHNEWLLNRAAGNFFNQHHPENAWAFRVRDAWMEVLLSQYCAGDKNVTAADIAKDYEILAKAGIKREEVKRMLDAAEAAGVPGRTSCLVG